MPANKDDGNLYPDHNGINGDEESIPMDAHANVEVVVEAPAVELVEDLHPDEGVEDYGAEVEFLRGDGGVVVEDAVAREVEDEDHG
jgi:hypothetical protein